VLRIGSYDQLSLLLLGFVLLLLSGREDRLVCCAGHVGGGELHHVFKDAGIKSSSSSPWRMCVVCEYR
jgi:hypothetical protein